MSDISVANCDRVTINMASVAGSGTKSVPRLRIENVTDLRLKYDSDEDPEPEPEGPESRNRPSNHGMAFLAKNVIINCDRNTFCGAGFDTIGESFLTELRINMNLLNNVTMSTISYILSDFSDFVSSRVNYMDKEAFHDLTEVKRVSFVNVRFAEEISKRAMSNVTVEQFSISDSNLTRIEHGAFDINVWDTFAIERTRIDYVEELAFYSIRAQNSSVMSFVNVSVSEGEDNAFKIQDHFRIGGVTNITYETPCDCEMYKVSGSGMMSHTHKKMNSTSLDNDLTLPPDIILNFVHCQDGGRYIPWSSFDEDMCAEDHGHAHDGILIPTISGLGKTTTLAIIIGGGIVLVIGEYF